MHGQTRAWFAAAWACLALLTALAAWAVPRCVVVCDATLVTAAEPEGWRDWPLADPGATCRGTCPGANVTRDGWAGVDGPMPPTEWLRHDARTGVFVVGGAPRADEAPRERFLGAFRREDGRRLAFTSSRAAGCALSLCVALAVMITGIGVARRRLRGAARRVESLRDAQLALASDPAIYRRAPLPEGRLLLGGAYDAGSAEGARLATSALRAALLAVLGLFVVFMVCAGGVAVSEWVRLAF